MQLLGFIKRELRRGKHPRTFGAQFIGDGAQRYAYLFADWVVKWRRPAWRHDRVKNELAIYCPPSHRYAIPYAPLLRCGVLPPEQHVVGTWVVQPYYRPLSKLERKGWEWVVDEEVKWRPCSGSQILIDVHPNNMGVHLLTGGVHIFDW